MKYYLLSLKWSKHQNQYAWWGPNNKGYTIDLNTAGIYTEEEIKSSPAYYSNTNVLPVPVEVVDNSAKMIVIPTVDANCELFGIHEHLKTAKEV